MKNVERKKGRGGVLATSIAQIVLGRKTRCERAGAGVRASCAGDLAARFAPGIVGRKMRRKTKGVRLAGVGPQARGFCLRAGVAPQRPAGAHIRLERGKAGGEICSSGGFAIRRAAPDDASAGGEGRRAGGGYAG